MNHRKIKQILDLPLKDLQFRCVKQQGIIDTIQFILKTLPDLSYKDPQYIDLIDAIRDALNTPRLF